MWTASTTVLQTITAGRLPQPGMRAPPDHTHLLHSPRGRHSAAVLTGTGGRGPPADPGLSGRLCAHVLGQLAPAPPRGHRDTGSLSGRTATPGEQNQPHAHLRPERREDVTAAGQADPKCRAESPADAEGLTSATACVCSSSEQRPRLPSVWDNTPRGWPWGHASALVPMQRCRSFRLVGSQLESGGHTACKEIIMSVDENLALRCSLKHTL